MRMGEATPDFVLSLAAEVRRIFNLNIQQQTSRIEHHSLRIPTMSLEQCFGRLTLRPSKVCSQCRRTLATSARQQAQQPQYRSATQSFTGIHAPNPALAPK